jgi:hypothetical protein
VLDRKIQLLVLLLRVVGFRQFLPVFEKNNPYFAPKVTVFLFSKMQRVFP